MPRLFIIILLAMLGAAPAFAAPNPTTPYTDFMRDRQGFTWRLTARGRDVTSLEMTSQKWKDSTWKHRIVIYQPKTLEYPDAAAMFLTTQRLPFDDEIGHTVADGIGAPFVMVYDVPNQPLWNREQNELFGYTVGKSIETGQADWSLAFPMAKTAVRAMDAVDVYNASSRNPEARNVTRWLQIGFSQRALAAWLAATDPRVKGLVSISYNNLNASAQAKTQLEDWGELSPPLFVPLEAGLSEKMETPSGQEMLKTWDPYYFHASLNKPSLVVSATGDQHWGLRAFDQYADDLPAMSNLLMVAGSDHDLEGAFSYVLNAAAAWCHWTLGDKPLPNPTLKRDGDSWSFEAPGAQATLLHWAWSKNQDFRKAEWQKMPMRKTSDGTWEAAIPQAPAGQQNFAVFALGNWQEGEQSLPLGSRVIIGKQ